MDGGRRLLGRLPLIALSGVVSLYVLATVWGLLFALVLGERPWGDGLLGFLDPRYILLDAALVWFVLFPSVVLVVVQHLLILPLRRPLTLTNRPRRPRAAAVCAGLVGSVLLCGLFVLLLELPQLPYGLGLTEQEPAWLESPAMKSVADNAWWILPALVLLAWAFWTVLLLGSLRRRPGGWLGRVIRRLIAGSLVELALAVPIYLIVRRRFDCWCALPSFWVVMGSTWALLALTGPGAVLLWRRRAGLPTDGWSDHCFICGYERAADVGARCPECGTRWGRVAADPARTGPGPEENRA